MARTETIPLNDARSLDRAAAVLAAGGLVVLPTDTVYGVAAALDRPAAIARLYFAKERPDEKPIPLLVSHRAALEAIAADLPPGAGRLIDALTPGGLTIVVRHRRPLPVELTGGRATVAVRIPDHAWVQRLIAAAGGALPTTSANRSGELPARTAAEAAAAIGDRVDLIVDGGPCPGGVASTVVDVTGPAPNVLREGAIPAARIAAIWAGSNGG